jgi:hypothetical protein
MYGHLKNRLKNIILTKKMKKPIYCFQCSKIILFNLKEEQATFCPHYSKEKLPTEIESLFGNLNKHGKR